jgi:hypothetical protein
MGPRVEQLVYLKGGAEQGGADRGWFPRRALPGARQGHVLTDTLASLPFESS